MDEYLGFGIIGGVAVAGLLMLGVDLITSVKNIMLIHNENKIIVRCLDCCGELGEVSADQRWSLRKGFLCDSFTIGHIAVTWPNIKVHSTTLNAPLSRL